MKELSLHLQAPESVREAAEWLQFWKTQDIHADDTTAKWVARVVGKLVGLGGVVLVSAAAATAVVVARAYKKTRGDPCDLFQEMSKFGWAGRFVYGKITGLAVPFTAHIAPSFNRVQRGDVELAVRQRWALLNPFGSIHLACLIAVAELTSGLSVVSELQILGLRGIPVRQRAEFYAKARGTVRIQYKGSRISPETREQEFETVILDASNKSVAKVWVTWMFSEKSKTSKPAAAVSDSNSTPLSN